MTGPITSSIGQPAGAPVLTRPASHTRKTSPNPGQEHLRHAAIKGSTAGHPTAELVHTCHGMRRPEGHPPTGAVSVTPVISPDPRLCATSVLVSWPPDESSEADGPART